MSENSKAVAIKPTGDIMERVLLKGDLAQLTSEERVRYYGEVCRSVGLNPLTKPFEYITLNGKLTLYALRGCTDQLRTIHNVSVEELTESERDGVFIVTAKVRNGEGRTDMAKGAVTINGLKGDALANSLMKAETKAKRRATLSLCGLGFLDETEIETIPEPAKGRITVAGEPIKTLPKKNAKEIYTRLEEELRFCTDRESLDAWYKEAAERIAIMPEDWQDILRITYKELLLTFKQREMGCDENGVIWEDDSERPATADDKPADDGLDIPASLKRNGDNKIAKTDWLQDLTDAYGKCTDAAGIYAVDQKLFTPLISKAFPPDRKTACAIRQEHFTRVTQTIMDAG